MKFDLSKDDFLYWGFSYTLPYEKNSPSRFVHLLRDIILSETVLCCFICKSFNFFFSQFDQFLSNALCISGKFKKIYMTFRWITVRIRCLIIFRCKNFIFKKKRFSSIHNCTPSLFFGLIIEL